jgi:hypothetical protein
MRNLGKGWQHFIFRISDLYTPDNGAFDHPRNQFGAAVIGLRTWMLRPAGAQEIRITPWCIET